MLLIACCCDIEDICHAAELNIYIWLMGFLGGSVVKNLPCQCSRHWFDLWLGKIFWWRKWHPTPAFILGKSHRQRSLVGYSPGDRTELDTTEQLSASTVWLNPVLSFCSHLTLGMSVSSTFSTRDWTGRFLRIFSSLKLFSVFSRPPIFPLVDYPPRIFGLRFYYVELVIYWGVYLRRSLCDPDESAVSYSPLQHKRAPQCWNMWVLSLSLL